MPRLVKGSAEAIAWGEKMKAIRKENKEAGIKSVKKEKKARKGRFPKGSAEAKEAMARVRAGKQS